MRLEIFNISNISNISFNFIDVNLSSTDLYLP